MADLLNVPLEVLLQITSHLSTAEYGCLRRTCKQIEALLFGAFAKEFFSKRQFALIEFSTQALVDIAKSRLGSSLTHIIIHLQRPHARGYPDRATASHEDAARYNRYRAECINHVEFTTTGLAVELLSDALRHLPNLETIGIRDFDSASRIRDETNWHSYGCPTFVKETGIGFVLPDAGKYLVDAQHQDFEYIRLVFLTVLRAMGDSAVCGWNPKLNRIEILLHDCFFPDQAFKIPNRFETAISLALSKLNAIFLDGLSGSILDFMVDSGDGTGPMIGTGYHLSRFLLRLSALKHLRLNFRKYDPSLTEKFLLWLANARRNLTETPISPKDSNPSEQTPGVLPAHFPSAPKFPNLQYLDIGMATVSQSVLLALYEKYGSSLRGVSLHKITLRCKNNTKINLWANLCNKMAAANLQLEMLSLSYIRQTSGERPYKRIGRVTFGDSRYNYIKTWRGSTFSQSVKDITNEMVPRWYEPNSEGNNQYRSQILSTDHLGIDHLEVNSIDDDDDDDDDDNDEEDDSDISVT